MSLIQDLFRSFMFFFDQIIYGFIPTVYQLLVYLSQIDIFSSEPSIGELMSQIYALLGIFMLFKISFSILQYLIDPNAFSDSSKGFGKILKNTLVALILLVMVPFIFSFAAKIQYVVVNSNILGNLILGSSSGVPQVEGIDDEVDITDLQNLNVTDFSEMRNSIEESAKDLQFLMYGAFFSLNTDIITECNGTPIFGSIEMAKNEQCLTKVEEEASKVHEITGNNVNLSNFFKYDGTTNSKGETCPNNVCDERDFGAFGHLLSWRIDNEYVINYIPIISAAAGIYIIFLLITFCIDIAVRAIKLCFLQMVAPISIVSYIDPKEDMGNSKLRNWINECVKTYISLFIRLLVIFFIIRLVSILASTVFSDDGFVRKLNANEYTIWIYVFLVLGAFMFAKQVPKMIEALFGWKGSGELNLNPLKSIKETREAIKPLTSAVSRTGKVGAGLGVGIAGLATGAGAGRVLAGAWNGMRGKTLKDVMSKTADGNRSYRVARAEGSTFLGRGSARLSSLFGTQGRAGRMAQEKFELDREIENRNDVIKQNNDQIRDYQRITGSVKAMEDRAKDQIVNGKSSRFSGAYKNYQEKISAMRESRQAMINRGVDVNSDEIKKLNKSIIAEEQKMNKFLDAAKLQYIDDVLDPNNSTTDGIISTKFDDYSRGVTSIGGTIESSSRDRKRQSNNYNDSINDLQRTVSDLQTQVSDFEQQKRELREQEQRINADLNAVHGQAGGRRRPPGANPPRGGHGRP